MQIRHDGNLNLAIGLSARSKTWRNKTMSWADLVSRLETPTVTNETLKEYEAAAKADKLKIKDVGGYVGGYLRGGRRKPENVVYRNVITLDLDFAHSEVWDDITLQFDSAMVLHATHSHTEANPKYRLILPLDRECTPDEYVAVSRYVAGLVGIDLFDSTGFQPYRLMFWPSVSKGVEYYFRFQDGPFIDVDAALATYPDWRDSSLWPTSTGQIEGAKTRMKKQEDPEAKKGIVGAFCRTYTIEEAIEAYLEQEYEPAGDERYTYRKGSTAGGLIVYENKFAYSHHGTDPVGGSLSNAFDLVRVHKFGHLDEDSFSRGVKLPSFKAMEALAREDKQVKRTLGKEIVVKAKDVFDTDFETEEEEDSLEWMEALEIDGKGKYLSCAPNISAILSNDPNLKGVFAYNTFDSKRYVSRSMPWRVVEGQEPIRNVDYSGVRNYLETVYGISASAKIDDCLALEFENNSYHPVRAYLKKAAKSWDGEARLERVLIDYLGAVDSLYTREAIKVWMKGAVARIERPGVKFELVLTLVGEQGCGKSTFFRKLGAGWTSDSFSSVHGKEAVEQLQGAWIMEIAELSGLRKSDVESVKKYMSKQEDFVRLAYARAQEMYKRQCVFGATTNSDYFLRDATGNRRFLPIDVFPRQAKLSIWDIPEETVAQLWGEAVHLYRKDARLYLDEKAEEAARGEQHKHRELDERAGLVERYLNMPLPSDWEDKDVFERRMYIDLDPQEQKGKTRRSFVCVAQVWCEALGQERDKMTRYNTREINEILRSLDDWEPVKSTKDFTLYGKQRYYTRKTD